MKRFIYAVLTVSLMLSPVLRVAAADTAELERRLFSAWEEKSDSVPVGDLGFTSEEELARAYHNAYYGNSQYLLTVDTPFSYSMIINDYGTVFDEIIPYYYSYTDNQQAELTAVIDKILARAYALQSDLEKVLYVHDYLCKTVTYDDTLTKYSVYDALVGHSAVCQGYALSFSLLLGLLGIKCEYVTSDSMCHAWNLVTIDGGRYYVDTTWDEVDHGYLLANEDELRCSLHGGNTHTGYDWLLNEAEPVCGKIISAYPDAFWKNCGKYSFTEQRGGFIYYTDGEDIYCVNGGESRKIVDNRELVFDCPTGGYYSGYSDIEIHNGDILWFSGREIFACNLKTGEIRTIYTATDYEKSCGSIYEITVCGDALHYYIGDSPSSKYYGTYSCEGEIQLDTCTHDFTEYTVTKPQINDENGGMMRFCRTCGYEEYELVRPCKHVYTSVVTPPTCTVDGYTTYTCEKCGNSYISDFTEATGHRRSIVGKVTATCTESGYTGDEVCLVCGEIFSKGTEIPALSHIPVTKNISSATCTSGGYTGDTYCDRCGELLEEGTVTDILPHNTIIINASTPTCKTYGFSGDEICILCGQTIKKGETTDKLPHETVIQNALTATCTQYGYTGDEVCDVCGEIIKTGVQLEKLPHQTEVQNALSPTCTEYGYSGDAVCKICNTTVAAGQNIPPLGHDYEDGKCTRCEAERPAADTCKCACHCQDPYISVIWKIFLAVRMTFGTGRTCSCGEMHY